MKIAPAIFGSSLLFVALSAHAEEPAPSPARSFLERTVVLDDVVGGLYPVGVPTGAIFTVAWLTFSSSKSKSANSDSAMTAYGIAPSADFFVGSGGLSVGGKLEIFHQDQRNSVMADPSTTSTSSSTSRAFAPRVGYAFAVTDFLVLWPRLELEFGSGETTYASAGAPDQSSHATHFQASGELAMVFPIQRHVAFSIGPRMSYFSSDSDDALGGESKQLYTSIRGAMRVAF